MQVSESFYEKKNLLRRSMTHAARRLAHRPRIIASLTSYPPRIGTVNVAIQSLLAQHCLPDLIVLWLYTEDFPRREKDLPPQLLHQLAHDVQIRWVDRDLKPHKKYFWALQEFPDDVVITFDDDLIYRNDLVADLMASYESHQKAISATRTHLITFDSSGRRNPYPEWIYEAPHYNPGLVGIPSMQLFATTGAGTLFPPRLMPEATFDVATIERTCLTADDLWMKGMQLMAGIPVVACSSNQLLNYVPDTQGVALCHVNTEQGKNSEIFERVLDHCERLSGGRDLAALMKDKTMSALYDSGKESK